MVLKPSRQAAFGLAPLAAQWLRQQGCLAWWPFVDGAGQTLRDMLNRAPGTVTESTWEMGPRGPVLRTDGTNDVVQMSGITKAGVGGMLTWAFWLRLHSSVANKGVCQIADGLSDGAPWLLLEAFNENGLSWYIDASYRTNYHIVGVGAWHHLALTYDGSTWRSYQNGQELFTYVGPLGSFNGGSLWIGNGYGGYSPCLFDDMRLYTRALTPAEIIKLYADPLAPWDAAVRMLQPPVGRLAAGVPAAWTPKSIQIGQAVHRAATL